MEKDKIEFGKLVFVFDWVERLKWMSFLAGVFACLFLVGFFLAVKDYRLFGSLLLAGCGCVGFLVCAVWSNHIREVNWK